MEKLLKPSKLSIDPNSASATKEWRHWLKTFKSYVSRYLSETSEEQAEEDKLAALISCSTPQVYELFDHCETYSEAEQTLDKLFVKRPHDIFARYLLRSARQEPNQSLAEFRSCLVKLAKDCVFKDVTASQYQDDMIRDAFINGISSSDIRQRLLENKTLSMKQAYEQALVIDDAKRESRMFTKSSSSEVSVEEINSTQQANEESDVSQQQQVASVNSSKTACFRCGSSKLHDYKNCRVKTFTCYKCGVKGHVSKVCHLQKRSGARAPKAPDFQGAAVVNEFLFSVYNKNDIDDMKSLKVLVESEVKGCKYKTLLDTGSSKSFVSESIALRFGCRKVSSSFFC